MQHSGARTHIFWFIISPLAADPLAITSPTVLEAVEGTFLELRVEASGGTGVGFTWAAVKGMPPGLELAWLNECVIWGPFLPHAEVDGELAAPSLRSISGMVASWRQPGNFWVHDDADSSLPNVYAIDASGRHRQTYHLEAMHTDWEDVALGPGNDGSECLYVGDFGDNNRSRGVSWLIRCNEPTVPSATMSPISLAVDVLYLKFPDGKRDIETLLFDWQTGTPYLIERNGSGCRVYKFPMPLDPSRTASDPVELILVTQTVTLPPTLTGGDSSRDGTRIVLRDYTVAYEYARPLGSSFDDIFFSTACLLGAAGNQQYEAITYGAGGDVLFTTTERAGRSASPILASRADKGIALALLKGVPTTSGVYLVDLEVNDSSGAVARQTVQIDVRPSKEPRLGALPGDCDQGGGLNIADAICLLDLLFVAAGAESPCDNFEGETRLLDFNGDADLDISDVLSLVIHLFGQGPAHVISPDCSEVAGCEGPCSTQG